jgi:hypothetical protein
MHNIPTAIKRGLKGKVELKPLLTSVESPIDGLAGATLYPPTLDYTRVG